MSEISIIIPIYNVAPYLKECLDSVLAQTFKNIEIILVDDGSTDNSGKIADEYAVVDNRIRVIHQSNEGLSAARNKGISVSNSPFLMFVDSDDIVDQHFCEIPYKLQIETGADVVCFEFDHYQEEPRQKKPIEQKVMSGNDAIFRLLIGDIDTLIVNRLYKKEIFREIQFPIGKKFEDMGTFYRILEKSNIICFTEDILYFYRRNRQGSITNTSDFENDPDRNYFLLQWQKKLIELNYNYPVKYDNVKVLNSALDYLVKHSGESESMDIKAHSVLRRLAKNKDYLKDISKKRIVLLYLCLYANPVFNIVCSYLNKR